MKTIHYERSEVISFYELTDDQQKKALSLDDAASETSYVIFEDEALPLNMFMRTTSGIFDGFWGMTVWSGYFIKLSNCGSMAVIADRYS